ncbi:splicing factor YJU2-like [Ruditapes philippinarum]|uniref:splicing factor YJU2-like n=1 Tax=Ruditapes philippinarum TaxID=129788 RepID=UPI00295B2254|nr:splicing factor YJU2-like [Ruditapes philippinarum]
MSERKVLNKYYPADYDPSKIPKGKRNRNATFNIRIMAPFNMRCNMCKGYIYKGKKFNSRKEDVMDEDYLGLKIFRFYIKCPTCVSEIAFKTDLERTDYTLEAGAKRLFEAEKIAQQMAEEERKAKEEDEMNPMKMLENRTKASRAEMDQIDTLEELREINSKKNQVNTEEMIEKYRKYEELLAQLQMEKEEEEIKDIFGEKGTMVVKRLNDSDSDEDGPVKKKVAMTTPASDTKPTDILAESDKSQSSQKPKESWQKSVGSLSSKQKLKGLVVRKKPSSLPSVSSTISSSEHASGSNDVTVAKHDDSNNDSEISKM